MLKKRSDAKQPARDHEFLPETTGPTRACVAKHSTAQSSTEQQGKEGTNRVGVDERGAERRHAGRDVQQVLPVLGPRAPSALRDGHHVELLLQVLRKQGRQ